MINEDIFLSVNKPARYIGQEWNVSRKDFRKADIRFALCFPDLYEIGMSNLGLRIIYGILNGIPDVACERFFSCGTDMQDMLKAKATEIFSLESGRSLRDFDIVGFSLGSELDYTNVLNILESGGIPLEASGRGNAWPLVIGGGPCTLNPEPMHEFFDLFVIGEAEDLIPELIDTYRRNMAGFKAARISRQELLFAFSKIEGVYAPSLYEAVYAGAGGSIEEFRPKIKGLPKRIKKRIVGDFNASYFPLDWLVPYIQIVHDRITLEVMRGCPNRCRFCQARSQYYPLRERDPKTLLDLVEKLYVRTGYEEMSLGGLSVSDYSAVEELLSGLIARFKKDAVSVSLPSIKAKAMVGGLSGLIASVKKTGLTFAPEAGSQRLREILAKDFDEGAFFQALEEAYSSGYQHVKLYFMVGLPHEKEEDLDAIIDLSTRVSELRRKLNSRPAQVHISINTLIPKPHTPLQWCMMQDLESTKKKQDYLRSHAKNRRLVLSFHNRHMGFLEGVLSRGDRRLSRLILLAFKKGARFDAWGDHFRFDAWLSAFKELGIEPAFYLQERSRQELLPWDFIDVGIEKDFFLSEFNKVIAIK